MQCFYLIEMSVNQRKVVLLTREEGNNHFWDSSFALRVPFRGNSNGEYKITVTEALFNNTEPLVSKGDWYQFAVYNEEGGEKYRNIWKVTMKKDIYLYRQSGAEWAAVILLLKGQYGKDEHAAQDQSTDYEGLERYREKWVAATADKPAHWEKDTTGWLWEMTYVLTNENGTGYTASNRGVNPIVYYELKDIKKPDNATPLPNISKAEMSYSWGFAYVLNNSNSVVNMVTDDDMKPAGGTAGHYYFEFCNLRLGGPYGYILATPTVKTTVLTQNEANQAYSIVGYVKNTADNHNENVQFISAMEGHVNSLSNFRVQLLKDNFEPVKIRSPLYINLTVSNEEDNGVPM